MGIPMAAQVMGPARGMLSVAQVMDMVVVARVAAQGMPLAAQVVDMLVVTQVMDMLVVA